MSLLTASIAAIAIAFSSLLLPVDASVFQQPQTLSIDFGAAPIRADWLGVSAVRHAFDYFPEETYRGSNATYTALSMSRMAAARLAGARTWYTSDLAMPDGWGGALNFSTPRFEMFVLSIADMQRANLTITLNVGWWFTQHTCGTGTPSNCTPTNASVDVYTAWVSASVHELIVVRGLTAIKTLLFFTEPLTYDSGNVPVGYTQQSFYAFVAQALQARMVADGTRGLVALQGPNDGSLASASGLSALNFTVSEMGDVLDAYSSHDYNLADYAAWLAAFQAARTIIDAFADNKPFIVDEGGHSDEAVRNASDYGTYLALWHAAAMNGGASSTHLWLWQDQYYIWPLENATNSDSFANGLHRWGLAFWLPDSLAVRPAYYCHTILTRFLRPPPGAAVVASIQVQGSEPGTGVVGAAVSGSAGTGRPDYHAILLINEGDAAVNISLTLAGGAAPDSPMTRYAYDPANVPTDGQLIGPSATFSGGALLLDSLPPRSVVVWTTQYEA